jgi:hypothetical protein
MSDTSQGDGWWKASDDKWYPPETHPEYVPPPPTSSEPTRSKSGLIEMVRRHPVWSSLVVGIALLFLIAGIAGSSQKHTDAGAGSSKSPATTTTTAPPATTTTTAPPPPPTTTTAPPPPPTTTAPPPPPTTTPGQNTAAMAPPGIAGPVPNVVGANLAAAEATLLGANLGYQTESSGLFGVIEASGWTVCSQNPSAGSVATSVNLIVARTC